MQSSTGAYYVGLDHLRAFAALLVFEWHFIHAGPVPFEYVPGFFPAAIVDEGHCGVALFMCLSGYLFAKLLDGKRINYRTFVWNRFVRLAPLLLAVIVVAGLGTHRNDLANYSKSILQGLLLPTFPNGGWSITVESHFYLLLPLVLLLLRRNLAYGPFIILAAIALRTGLYLYRGEIQTIAYWTIVGRIDQFVLGMVAFSLRSRMERRHILMVVFFLCFAAFYWYFDALGGFYDSPRYPSPYAIWIVLPTAEGLFFAALIAYYDTSFAFRDRGLSGLIAKAGTYSYSIYLTHFFYVFWMGAFFFRLFHSHNFYLAVAGGFAGFLFAAVLARFSYRYVERPFLQFRRRYIVDAMRSGEPLTSMAAPSRL